MRLSSRSTVWSKPPKVSKMCTIQSPHAQARAPARRRRRAPAYTHALSQAESPRGPLCHAASGPSPSP
eukprot:6287272-Prymnesium_polylepis.1